jgi:hypothetical protein
LGPATEITAHRPGPSAYGGDFGFDNLTVRIQRRVVSGHVYPPGEDRSFGSPTAFARGVPRRSRRIGQPLSLWP